MNVGRLKNKVRNQAAAITQLLESAKADKNLVETFKKTNTMLKGENDDLRVRCDEVEEMLRQAEANCEVKDKDIKMYQDTISNLQISKQQEEEKKKMFFDALNLKIKEHEQTEDLLNDYKKLYKDMKDENIRLEKQVSEYEKTRKPWYKKLLKC